MTKTAEIKVRAKAFTGRGIESVAVMVDADGTVRVYDDVAGHYTACHALGPHAIRRIRRLAKDVR
jgi:hypothetical protein